MVLVIQIDFHLKNNQLNMLILLYYYFNLVCFSHAIFFLNHTRCFPFDHTKIHLMQQMMQLKLHSLWFYCNSMCNQRKNKNWTNSDKHQIDDKLILPTRGRNRDTRKISFSIESYFNLSELSILLQLLCIILYYIHLIKYRA